MNKLNVLRGLRLKLGWSQHQLAGLVQLSQPVISYYENGLEIPPENARKLLTVLKDHLGETSLFGKGLSESMLGEDWSTFCSSLNEKR